MFTLRVVAGLLTSSAVLAGCGGDSAAGTPATSRPAPAGTVAPAAITSSPLASAPSPSPSPSARATTETSPVTSTTPTVAAQATYVPTIVPTTVAGTAAPAPTQPAASTPPPAPKPAGVVAVTVVANGNSYDRAQIRVRAGESVTATLQNNDAGVDHNLSFSVPGLGHGDTCKGPCAASQTFSAPAAGSYYFFCTLHPMSGDFIVDS